MAVTSMANSSISNPKKSNRMSNFSLPFNLQYFLVGGGGGAGGWISGVVEAYGGGGGEVLEDSFSAVAGNYTVTIGAGGAGQTAQNVNASSGIASSFGVYSANSGQGGGNLPAGRGGTSGSGFLGASRSGTTSGGGGGAGASPAVYNAGGAGVSSTFTGSSVGYGGGGSGFPSGGASDGGGSGTQNGATNRGGGAAAQGGSLANGGSGVVMIKVPAQAIVSVGAGLTYSTSTVGGLILYQFTSGTGTVTIR